MLRFSSSCSTSFSSLNENFPAPSKPWKLSSIPPLCPQSGLPPLPLRLNLPPLSPPSPSPSPGLSGSIRSVVRSMAEAEPAALLSALQHNTSLQLTAGLQNAPYARTHRCARTNTVARRSPASIGSAALTPWRMPEKQPITTKVCPALDCTTFPRHVHQHAGFYRASCFFF